MKYWEIIAGNLRKAGWRCGTGHEGRQFWVAAAKREDAERFIVHADKKLTTFLEVEAELNSVDHIASSHEVEQDGLSTRARM